MAQTNTTPVQDGYKAAAAMEQAEGKATDTKRNIVLKLATTYSEDDAKLKAVLEGVQQYHVEQKHSDGFTRRIKSEIKAVFDAIGSTLVSGENAEKLEVFKGTWHEWIDLARTLRGKKEGSSGSRKTSTRDLSDTGYEKVQDGINKATPAQLITLAGDMASIVEMKKPTETIGGKIVSLVGILLLKQIRLIAGRLANSTEAEEALKTVGKEIYELTGKVVTNYEAQQHAAKQKELSNKESIQAEALAA